MVAQFPQKKNLTVVSDLPPQNIEAEESILGGILLDPHAIARIVNFLEVEAFYLLSHQEIYSICLKLYKNGQPTDFLIVKSYLEDHGLLESVGGINKLSQLLDRTVSAVNIDRYAELVVLKYQQRKAIAYANEIQELAFSYLSEGSQPIKTFLEQVEKKSHVLTRGKHRGEINDDEETRQAKELTEKIKEIESYCDDATVKEFKKDKLARKYKISRKTLETIYLKTLLQKDNQPSEPFSEFLKKNAGKCDEWFIHGLLPKGSLTQLHAAGGEGKSRFAYNLYKSLVVGKAWNGFPVTASNRNALIVQTDESSGDMARALQANGYTENLPVRIKTNWTVDHMNDLRNEIINHNIEVVIIDSLTTVSKGSMFSENEVQYAIPILEMKRIAEETGASILLIHHSNKEGGSRGTSAIRNSVDQVLKLEKLSEGSDPTSPERRLIIEKSRARRPAKLLFRITVNEEDFSYHYEYLGEDLKEPDPYEGIKQAIVEFLSKNRNQPLSNRELSDALGANYNTVRRATFQLATDGIITRQQLDTQGKPWVFYLTWEGEENTIEAKPFEKIPVNYKGGDQMIKARFDQADEVSVISFNEDGTVTLLFEQNGLKYLKYTKNVPCNDVKEAQDNLLTPPE